MRLNQIMFVLLVKIFTLIYMHRRCNVGHPVFDPHLVAGDCNVRDSPFTSSTGSLYMHCTVYSCAIEEQTNT